MKKVFAFALLAVFAILVLVGSVFIVFIPYSLGGVGNQNPHHYSTPPPQNMTGIYFLIAFVCLAVGYGASYLIVESKVNGYLSGKFAYSKFVTLGFVLHVVVGALFVLAVLGGYPGSAVMKAIVMIVLFAPLVLRIVYLKMQPDRRFDNFLAEDDIQEENVNKAPQ